MEKVKEIVEVGSPFLALGQEFVTSEEVLAHLVTFQVRDRTLCAYRAVCAYDIEAPQYVNDEHFLAQVSAPEYGAIYILSGGNPKAFLKKDTPGETLEKHLVGSLLKLNGDDEFKLKMKVICDKKDFKRVFMEEKWVKLIVGAKASHLIDELVEHREEIAPLLLRELMDNDLCGYIHEFPLSEITPQVLRRCQCLVKTAPHYWKMVEGQYHDFLEKVVEKKAYQGTTREDALFLKEMFREAFPDIDLNKLSDLAYKVSILELPVKAYILGFPLHLGLPTSETLRPTLYHLAKMSIEEYAKEVAPTAIHFNIKPPFGAVTLRNGEDVLGTGVVEYNSFDRVHCVSGSNGYVFVRHEFETLLKTKKNHWTNEALPLTVECEIKARLKMASALHLPPPGTIQELLTRLSEGTLFKSPFPASSSKPSESDSPTINQLLNQFFDSHSLSSSSSSSAESASPNININRILSRFFESRSNPNSSSQGDAPNFNQFLRQALNPNSNSSSNSNPNVTASIHSVSSPSELVDLIATIVSSSSSSQPRSSRPSS